MGGQAVPWFGLATIAALLAVPAANLLTRDLPAALGARSGSTITVIRPGSPDLGGKTLSVDGSGLLSAATWATRNHAAVALLEGGNALGTTSFTRVVRTNDPLPTRPASSTAHVTNGTTVSSDRLSRSRVPVGCDRLVSVLVRSASADRLGRCVT